MKSSGLQSTVNYISPCICSPYKHRELGESEKIEEHGRVGEYEEVEEQRRLRNMEDRGTC